MSALEQTPDFKKNLWGYDRDCVHQYMSEVQKSEEEFQKKLDTLTRSREELEERIADFEKQLQNSQNNLDGEKGKNKKLSQMIRFLQEEIDRQRRLYERQNKEYQEIQARNEALSKKMQTAQNQGNQYQEAASSIGSAILQAQKTADHIIDSANDQAKTLGNQAGEMADQLLEDIKQMYQEFQDFRDGVSKTVEQMNTRFDQIESDMLKTGEKVLIFKKNLPKDSQKQQ